MPPCFQCFVLFISGTCGQSRALRPQYNTPISTALRAFSAGDFISGDYELVGTPASVMYVPALFRPLYGWSGGPQGISARFARRSLAL